ncbi:MAG: molecular chaperone [Planctomycetaceae bacterium]
MSSQVLNNATERAAVYGLLSAFWQDVPSAEVLTSVAQLPVQTMPPAFAQLADACGTADREELEVEFTRLFIGPKEHLPPFQSVWQEQQLDGEAAVAMRRFADVIGLSDNADHFANQLLAMQTILQAETGDSADGLESLAASFFAQHLCWADLLLEAVSRRAETAVYRELAVLTQQFLRSEADLFTG